MGRHACVRFKQNQVKKFVPSHMSALNLGHKFVLLNLVHVVLAGH